jgi:hypothetical protein
MIFLLEILKADCGLVGGKSITQIKPIEKAVGLFVRRPFDGKNAYLGEICIRWSMQEAARILGKREMRLSRNCTRRE